MKPVESTASNEIKPSGVSAGFDSEEDDDESSTSASRAGSGTATPKEKEEGKAGRPAAVKAGGKRRKAVRKR